MMLQGAAANVPTAIGILGTTFRPGRAKTYAFAAYGECKVGANRQIGDLGLGDLGLGERGPGLSLSGSQQASTLQTRAVQHGEPALCKGLISGIT